MGVYDLAIWEQGIDHRLFVYTNIDLDDADAGTCLCADIHFCALVYIPGNKIIKMAMGLFLTIQWRWVVKLGPSVNALGDVPGMIRPGIKDGNSCDLGFNGL